MKTKPIHKKGKKRPLREPSLPSKSDKKSDNITESKKNRKKVKIDNNIQNGSPVPKTEMQVLRKINKQQKKQKKVKEEDDGNIRKLSKAKVKTNVAEETKQAVAESKEKTLKAKEKKLEELKNKQLIREMNKTLPKKPRTSRYRASKHTIDLEQLINKVTEIKSRGVLSKTAKKRVAVLLKKIYIAQTENKSNTSEAVGEDDKKNKQQANVSAKNKQKANIKNKRNARREHGKNKKTRIDREDNNEYVKDDEDQSDMEVEEEEEINIAQGKVESIEDEEDRDEEDDEKTAIVETKKKKKTADLASDVPKKKETKNERYVLSVSNLPYE